MFNPDSDYYIYNELYFAYDKPVPYHLKNGRELNIYPIMLQDSLIFLTSCDILTIDKNISGSADIIQMSYLKYIVQYLLCQDNSMESNNARQKIVNIFALCFHIKSPYVMTKDNGKICICDTDNEQIEICEKDFEDLRRIIMYQNILNYDDRYIDPDLKKAIDETKELKNKNISPISTERKIAIIISHTGYNRSSILEMTYRSFTALFNEVCEEVDFITTRPIALYAGKSKNIEHWIYKKKKDKYSDYVMSVEEYNKSMGGDGNVLKGTKSSHGDDLDAIYQTNSI